MDKALLFEITSITLLFVLGVTLQLNGLPGWGLISVAALMMVSCAGLRLVNARNSSWLPTTSAG